MKGNTLCVPQVPSSLGNPEGEIQGLLTNMYNMCYDYKLLLISNCCNIFLNCNSNVWSAVKYFWTVIALNNRLLACIRSTIFYMQKIYMQVWYVVPIMWYQHVILYFSTSYKLWHLAALWILNCIQFTAFVIKCSGL